MYIHMYKNKHVINVNVFKLVSGIAKFGRQDRTPGSLEILLLLNLRFDV